jgi:hypothetical protein
LDVANLFNPAYCAGLLNKVASGYRSTLKQGLPYPLAFIAMPIVLHPTTTSLLPGTARSRMHAWLLENPEVIFGFGDRARSIAPFVREAVSFGVQNKVLKFGPSSTLVPLQLKEISLWERRSENSEITKKAQVLGKLLSQFNDVSTVFSLFGVRP